MSGRFKRALALEKREVLLLRSIGVEFWKGKLQKETAETAKQEAK